MIASTPRLINSLWGRPDLLIGALMSVGRSGADDDPERPATTRAHRSRPPQRPSRPPPDAPMSTRSWPPSSDASRAPGSTCSKPAPRALLRPPALLVQ